jgi:hypothetical protein
MLPDFTFPDIALPDTLFSDLLPDITLPDSFFPEPLPASIVDSLLPDITLSDMLLPAVILFDDLPWPEEEEGGSREVIGPAVDTGDSTAAAIRRSLGREERENFDRWYTGEGPQMPGPGALP